MLDQNKNQSLEMNSYRNIYENHHNSSPISSKSKNYINPENNKENYDSNKPYLISDNSVSAINPLSKSRDNLYTSNNISSTNNLFTAVEYNDIERVNELLKQDNSKINELNEEGLSLLHIAVIKANTKMIDLLLLYGADSNILSDKKKQTPLHLAYLNKNSMTEEIIKELLKYKAKENIYDAKNKKPSDYMGSSIKKDKHKKFNNENNDSPDKKSNMYNNTGNTITVVTIDNHLDSFLTTNKEDENKSNHNNTNSNNNTIVQTPTKLDIDYDFNELISINESVEKSCNQINNNKNNLGDNKTNINERNRRQYTFGKEEDFLKFQNKNNNLCIDIKNINNNVKNNILDNIDINNNFNFENTKKENRKINNNNEEKKDVLNKDIQNGNEILNDSLEEENNYNDNKGELGEDEEDEKEEEISPIPIYDSLRKNKDNNTQISSNINNNSLSYTDSLNINGSCFQSKNKINHFNIENGSHNNTNEDDDEEIILKPPCNDNIINMKLESMDNPKEKINDVLLTKIIKKKRNSVTKLHKLNSPKVSRFSINNNLNGTFRHSAYNNNRIFNLGERERLDNTLKSNRTNRTNYISPFSSNNNDKYSKNNIKNISKQSERENYNTNLANNHSYKNSITVIHNGTDSRIGFSGDNTQFSSQSQNNKKKNIYSSKDKIKVIMNDNNNSTLNNLNSNQGITEFNYTDNLNNITNSNLYNNNENIDKNTNVTYLKFWLNNLGLTQFLNHFINNNIYDINELVERMKSYQTKLRFDSLESMTKIRTPGYIYRLLCKLEADAGLIDPKIIKFMINEGSISESKNIMNRSINNNENKLNISVNQSYYQCSNCCKTNQIKKSKKNDLKYFLSRYDMMNLYKNFYHNGFDLIEYVIIQMYSSFPINEDILENHFHIYDEKQRIKTLKAIVAEMKKINRFINSDEYNNSCDKNAIKYDNVAFEESEDKDKSKIILGNNDNNDSNCIIF